MDYDRCFDLLVREPALITELAQTSLEASERPVLGMRAVRSASVRHTTGEWFVCRAPQDPSCARLLDVAVKLRDQRDVPCLAILEPPRDKEGAKVNASDEDLRAYQGILWRAFRVAFVLDDARRNFAPARVVPTAAARADFDRLVAEVKEALREDASTAAKGTRWMLPEDSREAEALVRLTMNRVVGAKGYRRKIDGGPLGKTYKGFWRGAEADGVWSNDEAQVRRLALESKLNEDTEAPLCQPVDHLAHLQSGGHIGGVLCVRVHRANHAPRERTADMKRLEEALLVRYLDITLDG